MFQNLEASRKPLLFLDVEATGLSISEDRVIQIGMAEMLPGSTKFERVHGILINPGRPIPSAITELTDISDEEVSGAKSFADVAPSLREYFAGFDLVGFGLINFDIPILAEEFHRCGIEPPFDAATVIDCGIIFKRKEERTLAAAVRFYCGREAEECHDALADAMHTAAVLEGQIARYGLTSVADAATLSRYPEDRRIDYAGKISRDAEGHPVYAFGAKKGVRVRDEMGFARWMLDKDFPLDTKARLREILDQIYAEDLVETSKSGLPF